MHGLILTEVHARTWMIVDAVHSTSSLSAEFPVHHDEEREIARKFKETSAAEFDNCYGAMDGLLIWIFRPTLKDEADSDAGPKKYL